MKLLEYIFYRFFMFFYPVQPAGRAAFMAMLLFSISIYIYLFNLYALMASFGWVRFVSLFVSSSHDFTILFVGVVVQLLIYQCFIHENRFVKIHQFFSKYEVSSLFKVFFISYLALWGMSLLSFLIILEYTSRLG